MKEPTGGCLEEIFRRYPFLPRTTTKYIFVRPGIFDEFDQQCLPCYPLQIGRCCFRIDYSKDVINQILPSTPMTTRHHVEKWIRIVDGVTKTFSNYNTPYVILHYFYNRSIDILSQSSTIILIVDDMSKLLRYLKRNISAGVENEKLRLVAFMIRRLGDSIDDRIHYIRHHWKDVMNVFSPFPPLFEAGDMLFSLPPYPETVPLWIKLYQLFSQHLTNGKKKRILAHYFQNIMQVITEEQHDEEEDMDEIKRSRVLQLYQELKHEGIEEEILLPVLVHFFHRHHLLPGNLNKIKTTLLAIL